MTTSATESIEFRLQTDADSAFPLFSAQRERDWDPDWKPQFVTDEVFIVDVESVWIRTVYDAQRRRIEYVRVTPRDTVGQISIQLQPIDATSCAVNVTYRLTALSAAGRSFIAHWQAEFAKTGERWGAVLNHYIATGKPLGMTYDVLPA